MTRRRLCLALGLVLSLAGSGLGADWPRVEVEPPRALVVRTNDGRQLSGRLRAYDGEQFELRVEGEEVHTVAWRDLPAGRAHQVLGRLMDVKDAEASLRLGALMMTFGDEGKPLAEQSLRRALALDGSLAARADAIRSGEPDPGRAAPAAPVDGADSEAPSGNPDVRGAVQARFWGDATDAEQAAAVDELKAFARDAVAELDVRTGLYETAFFLFYSDIPVDEAREWATLLDRMYARLSDLFGIPAGENLWRGKALVFVFASESTYRAFETRVLRVPPGSDAAGRCWQYGDGRVIIAFYRQPARWLFAHVLVHETVHGFLHRYRSPARIPSAWNEGLAEVIANELVPQSPVRERRRTLAANELRARGNLGGFFEAGQIEGWQYGVASTLTEYMIAQNKRGYVAFINGIKDGLTWRESLDQHYRAPLDRLIQFYGESMRIRNLRP